MNVQSEQPTPPVDDDVDALLAADRALETAASTRQFFGPAYPGMVEFARALRTEGELRGLIGPRELPRLWSRHLFNSAAVVQFLPDSGVVVDVGSGAGLPGIVVAAMRPDLGVVLVEPMDRRCAWLQEMSERLRLDNVEVRRGRAEEFAGALEADVVTARAVASLDKLARMTLPLLRPGGELLALKGRNVANEIPKATPVLKKFRASAPEILTASTVDEVDDTLVVRVRVSD